ncbi:hypothetical protein M011DRAFT_479676 [Sporormia fimetaria CBS 119925]|uniref:Uncharacterized protein n=1 Tax=Sporormia fimetaria CBS 119925 TaxID=1340428 RepID=A0A6A6V5Q1_9PLEO|nr:hypothetical protein M011DRAFT_479676 [Sporormia fimetaria CBS 119925]
MTTVRARAVPTRPSIPTSVVAVGDFNGVPSKTPPYRDVPSILLRDLTVPQLDGPEPDWMLYLSHYFSRFYMRNGKECLKEPHVNLANLQDLFILVARIVLPNQILENQKLLEEVYMTYPRLVGYNRARYDFFDSSPHGAEDPQTLPISVPTEPHPIVQLTFKWNVSPRSIMRALPTPNGTDFHEWLCTRPLPRVEGQEIVQLAHRQSEMDQYLTVPEEQVRSLSLEQLLRRTTRILQMYWWVAGNNARLKNHKANRWVTFGSEMGS